MFSHSWPLRGPSQEDVTTPVYELDGFQNTLPQISEKSHALPLTRPSRHNTDAASPVPTVKPASLKTLFWPAVAICIPIALLSATLLTLVFAYQVKSVESIFQDGSDQQDSKHSSYILVNFSATRIVFAASFLSTVAPLLASFIMTLWSMIASANMRHASSTSHFDSLPTPYQLSMLVGLCLASVQQLRSYLWYATSPKRQTRLPPVVNKAAAMFILTIALASAVFVADTALHYLTSTILFDQISKPTHLNHAYGYGLSKMCLDLDREDNGGFPCSMPVGLAFDDPNRTAKRNEMSRLQSNASSTSQVRLTGAQSLAGVDVAIMLPLPANLPAGTDYRASTVGVAAVCHLVPPSVCGMKSIGQGAINTQFNCSDNFFGVLGKSPNISSAGGEKAIDSDLSPLGFKPATNLQWAFFSDNNMSTLWNPESWDPEIDQPDLKHIVPDDKLINPFHVATAARLSLTSFTPNTNMTASTNVFSSANQYVDFIMSCTVTSYSVNYTWFKSSIQNVTIEPSDNGTLLENFHGTQVYNSVSGGDFDLQQNLVNAGIAGNSTASFLKTWADLYSVKVLSLVGAYLSPRENLEEQSRQASLVAKVPKSALGALVGCSLIYTVLGVLLVIMAYRTSSQEVAVVAEQLSLAGLTNMAFGEKTENSSSFTVSPGSGNNSRSRLNQDDYFTRLPRKESRRVRISGTDFRVWV